MHKLKNKKDFIKSLPNTEKEDGYIIVQYNFSNANVEVINTKGYNGNYTLTQIIKKQNISVVRVFDIT